MIKTITDCEKCIHNIVCRLETPNQEMERLKGTTHGKPPNSDYPWNYIYDNKLTHINVVFECIHFREIKPNVRNTEVLK